MKILLAIPDYKQKDYSFPLGITYISSYLKSKEYDVTAFNANHHSVDQLREILHKDFYDIIGTGGLFNHLPFIKFFMDIVRQESPRSRIILGGAIACGDPEFILESLKPDYLVLGEGERTTDFLLQALKDGSDLKKVTGIAFKENGDFIRTPPTPLVENLDELPFPDYEGFEYGYFLDNLPQESQDITVLKDGNAQPRIGGIISSRNCACKCTFCFRLMGGGFRIRSIENIIKEIQYLQERYHINYLNLLDDMFAANQQQIKEFCRMIKQLRLPWCCQMRVNLVSDGILESMKDAGCCLVSYGFESASEKVLKSMKKGITLAQIERAIQGTLKAKMTIQGNFIFGDPAETLETAEETIRFARKYKKLSIGFGFIIPYPGTILYQDLVKMGILTERLLFHINPGHKIYNMTALSDVDFQYLIKKISVEHAYRNKYGYGKITKLKRIKNNVYNISISCQHCGETNQLEGFDVEKQKKKYRFFCKNCLQRVCVNLGDIRFRNFRLSLFQLYYLYAMKLAVLTPFTFSISLPFIRFITKIKKKFRFTVLRQQDFYQNLPISKE